MCLERVADLLEWSAPLRTNRRAAHWPCSANPSLRRAKSREHERHEESRSNALDVVAATHGHAEPLARYLREHDVESGVIRTAWEDEGGADDYE